MTPKVLTPQKCEIPCCHDCTCDLLMCVCDVEHKPLNGHDASLLGACLVAVTRASTQPTTTTLTAIVYVMHLFERTHRVCVCACDCVCLCGSVRACVCLHVHWVPGRLVCRLKSFPVKYDQIVHVPGDNVIHLLCMFIIIIRAACIISSYTTGIY